MKKALLPLMIASLVPAAAMADVTLYGKANVSFQSTQKADLSYTEVVSNASRIGVKGGEVINDDLKFIYLFEYQTKVDDGSNSGQTFSQRNIYVGLQGTGGTVTAGMFDTPLKLAQEKIDLFNDLVGDLTEVLEGENRAKNIIQYSTPSYNSITLNTSYISAEKDEIKRSCVPTSSTATSTLVAGVCSNKGTLLEESAANGFSISAVYNTAPVYLALAFDQNAKLASDQTLFASKYETDLLRAVGRFTIGPVVLGVMYETYDNGKIDEDGMMISSLYNLNDKWALKAQFIQSDMKKMGGESTSIGADYKMSKAAKLYGFYTVIQDDVLVASTGVRTGAFNTRDDKLLGVGIELNF